VDKLPSNPCLSTWGRPKILKICQDTNFDMGFQENNMRSRSEKVDFLNRTGFSDSAT
jgi:hypothetical protein